MDENNIKNLIRSEIDAYMSSKQYDLSKIPNHTHNGLDSNKVEQINIVYNIRVNTLMSEDESETFTIQSIENPNRLCFQGFAANNADGTPATKRAILNGEVQFGRGYYFALDATGITPNTANNPGMPFVQSSNGMYVDSTTLANNRVSTSNLYFVHATDNTGAIIASMKVDSYQKNIITITATVGTNWKIQGILSLT